MKINNFNDWPLSFSDYNVNQSCGGSEVESTVMLPSGSNILGMSRYFSAMSKARLRFSNGLSCEKDGLELVIIIENPGN